MSRLLHTAGDQMVMNALSVDVEEHYHAGIFRRGASASVDARCRESRVEANVDRLLALFDTHSALATFFVLGEIAAAHPVLLRRIAAGGHEIACHGDRHDDVYRQTPEEFRTDIRRAKAGIEDAVGHAIIGYRAPNFSIGRAQGWAYDILLEEGFRYDSSTYPILHDRYGQVGGPRFPFEIWRSGSERLVEFPIGTAQVLGVALPIGGGGYFRLAPEALFRMGINRVNRREHRPVMFYLHPWELDPAQPRAALGWRDRFRLYVGVGRLAGKLDRLLGHVRFGTARQVIETQFPVDLAPKVASPAQTRGTGRDSIRVWRLPADQPEVWTRGLSADSHLAHASEWATIINRAYGHEPIYLAAEDHDGGTGLLPAFVVRRPIAGPVVASMPYLDGGGPCSRSTRLDGGLVRRLVEEARRVGAGEVELRCSRPLEIHWRPAGHKVNLTLDLPAEAGDLWRRLDGSVRNQVRKAERAGLSVERGGGNLLDEFHAIFAARMRDLGSPVHSRAFFQSVLDAFVGRARVVLVRQGATAVGGLIALAHRETLAVPWASCLTQSLALCPNMILYWDTIRAACGEGFRRFEFGRSTRGSGTYRFKRQWGAIEQPLLWYTIPVSGQSRRALINGRASRYAVRLWQSIPLAVTRSVGPRVRKYLIQ